MIATTGPEGEGQINEEDAHAYHNDQQDLELVVPWGCLRLSCGVGFCLCLVPRRLFRLRGPCAARSTSHQ
ncbi:hypothetical protein CHS0354_021064, partial [Potamilus streckersoni]